MNSALVLIAALAGSRLARRLGSPVIVGELVAGILTGPQLLPLLQPEDALAVVGKLSDNDDVVVPRWLCEDLTADTSQSAPSSDSRSPYE